MKARSKIGLILALLCAAAIATAVFLQSDIGKAETHATGLVMPKGWEKAAPWDDQAETFAAPPAHWDWNEHVQLQPIRDQKSCGSCWDFSVTAVAESLARMLHPERQPAFDLSEQAVLSCSGKGSCQGGYFNAFDYIRSGIASEAQMPYAARDLACPAGLRPVTRITRWAYIGSRQAPSTALLKAAIYDHGPISVSVNGNFGNYRGGVFTACGSTAQNHMVNIEGWVDDPAYARNGGGYWIMRNSWGPRWGDAGRMKIAYNATTGAKCNGIGSVGAYAIMENVENIREHMGL